MTRCIPCVEKKLRSLLAEERKKNQQLREALKAIIDDAAPEGNLGGNHRVDAELIYDAASLLGRVSDE